MIVWHPPSGGLPIFILRTMKKHILVTGGTGYIGSHMVVRLIEAGMEPIIFDNFSNSKPAVVDRIEMITGKRPTLVRGDIRDEKALEKLFTVIRLRPSLTLPAAKPSENPKPILFSIFPITLKEPLFCFAS